MTIGASEVGSVITLLLSPYTSFISFSLITFSGLPSAYIKGKDCFMLKIKGDSMVDVGIMDKDYIIVDAADTRADNGKIVVALINGESATVKTIEKKNGKIWLIPQNSAYEPMIFEPDQVKVMGSVTGVFRVY